MGNKARGCRLPVMQKDWQLCLHISCQHMLMPAALLRSSKKLDLEF